MLKARVIVMLKSGVLDPQGRAVRGGLHAMGYAEVEDIRVGKEIVLTLHDMTEEKARARVKEMCEKLLANPVIEEFSFTLERG
jgi:phosphoribosylformylglycinamidine synthase